MRGSAKILFKNKIGVVKLFAILNIGTIGKILFGDIPCIFKT